MNIVVSVLIASVLCFAQAPAPKPTPATPVHMNTITISMDVTDSTLAWLTEKAASSAKPVTSPTPTAPVTNTLIAPGSVAPVNPFANRFPNGFAGRGGMPGFGGRGGQPNPNAGLPPGGPFADPASLLKAVSAAWIRANLPPAAATLAAQAAATKAAQAAALAQQAAAKAAQDEKAAAVK